jgi:hypothetical protein
MIESIDTSGPKTLPKPKKLLSKLLSDSKKRCATRSFSSTFFLVPPAEFESATSALGKRVCHAKPMFLQVFNVRNMSKSACF